MLRTLLSGPRRGPTQGTPLFALAAVVLVACGGHPSPTVAATSAVVGDDAGPRANPMEHRADDAGALEAAAPARTCSPGPVTFQPTAWVPPPTARVAACSPTQIQVLATCMNNDTVTAACSQFWQAPENDSCIRCANTPEGATVRGPLYDQGAYTYVNYPGCIAAMSGDTSQGGCGARYDRLLSCEDAFCGHCDVDGIDACLDAADKGGCATYAAALDCAKTQETACTGADYFGDVVKVVSLFCGQ